MESFLLPRARGFFHRIKNSFASEIGCTSDRVERQSTADTAAVPQSASTPNLDINRQRSICRVNATFAELTRQMTNFHPKMRAIP
jgi:hypothetical protein